MQLKRHIQLDEPQRLVRHRQPNTVVDGGSQRDVRQIWNIFAASIVLGDLVVREELEPARDGDDGLVLRHVVGEHAQRNDDLSHRLVGAQRVVRHNRHEEVALQRQDVEVLDDVEDGVMWVRHGHCDVSAHCFLVHAAVQKHGIVRAEVLALPDDNAHRAQQHLVPVRPLQGRVFIAVLFSHRHCVQLVCVGGTRRWLAEQPQRDGRGDGPLQQAGVAAAVLAVSGGQGHGSHLKGRGIRPMQRRQREV
mmetsp:Transcript_37704/g.70231  ORF Transcript_37704/g.70231 Transcript_37704/m.70231 type:complete len:249 (-) Transcript_37704:612-1358(-)